MKAFLAQSFACIASCVIAAPAIATQPPNTTIRFWVQKPTVSSSMNLNAFFEMMGDDRRFNPILRVDTKGFSYAALR